MDRDPGSACSRTIRSGPRPGFHATEISMVRAGSQAKIAGVTQVAEVRNIIVAVIVIERILLTRKLLSCCRGYRWRAKKRQGNY